MKIAVYVQCCRAREQTFLLFCPQASQMCTYAILAIKTHFRQNFFQMCTQGLRGSSEPPFFGHLACLDTIDIQVLQLTFSSMQLAIENNIPIMHTGYAHAQ